MNACSLFLDVTVNHYGRKICILNRGKEVTCVMCCVYTDVTNSTVHSNYHMKKNRHEK